MSWAQANPTSTSNTALVAAVTGEKIRILRFYAANDGTANVVLSVKDGTTVKWRIPLAHMGSFAFEAPNVGRPLVPESDTTVSTAVNVALDTTGSVRVHAEYTTYLVQT